MNIYNFGRISLVCMYRRYEPVWTRKFSIVIQVPLIYVSFGDSCSGFEEIVLSERAMRE